jgi:hypothetical protein
MAAMAEHKVASPRRIRSRAWEGRRQRETQGFRLSQSPKWGKAGSMEVTYGRTGALEWSLPESGSLPFPTLP